jgi:hypothetical protein
MEKLALCGLLGIYLELAEAAKIPRTGIPRRSSLSGVG